MSKLKFCFFVSLLFFIAGCSNEPDLDLEIAPAQLVVWGYLSPENLVSLEVKHSLAPLSGEEERVVDDALVILFENGIQVDTLVYEDNGFYQSTSIYPTVGHSYQVEVQHDDYPTLISNEDEVPIAPLVTSYEAFDSLRPFASGQVLAQINIVVENFPFEQGFIGRLATMDSGESNWWVPDYHPCTDFNGFRLKDMEFADYTCLDNIETIILETTNYRKNELDHLSLKLCLTDPNAYDYHLKLAEYYSSFSGDVGVDVFFEPIHLPNSIENGYGYFGVYNCTTLEIQF